MTDADLTRLRADLGSRTHAACGCCTVVDTVGLNALLDHIATLTARAEAAEDNWHVTAGRLKAARRGREAAEVTVQRVRAVLIENGRHMTNQAALWDMVYDALAVERPAPQDESGEGRG